MDGIFSCHRHFTSYGVLVGGRIAFGAPDHELP